MTGIDPHYAEYNSLSDTPPGFLHEFENFFTNDRQFEGTTIKVEGWKTSVEAMQEVQASVARFDEADSEDVPPEFDYEDFE